MIDPSLREYAALLAQAAALSNSRVPHDRLVGDLLRESCQAYLAAHPDLIKLLTEAGARGKQKALEAHALLREKAKIWGPPLWNEWHPRALRVEAEFARAGEMGQAALLAQEVAWLQRFALKVPCGSCRAHFLKLLTDLPLRLADYFAYTVEVHNAVSAAIPQPVLSLEKALARWSA